MIWSSVQPKIPPIRLGSGRMPLLRRLQMVDGSASSRKASLPGRIRRIELGARPTSSRESLRDCLGGRVCVIHRPFDLPERKTKSRSCAEPQRLSAESQRFRSDLSSVSPKPEGGSQNELGIIGAQLPDARPSRPTQWKTNPALVRVGLLHRLYILRSASRRENVTVSQMPLILLSETWWAHQGSNLGPAD